MTIGAFTPAIWNSSPASLPSLAASSVYTAQTTAMGLTTIMSPLKAGYYEILFYMTVPAGLSATGAITLTLSWTDSRGTQSFTSGSLSVNAKGYVQGVIFVEAVDASSISYVTNFLTIIGSVSYNIAVLVKRFQ